MYTNGFNYIIINLISIASVMCGILVIISKNPIVSVLFLIGLFISIAGYLMMLGINFIGLSYLLVYVGAVSILFLFILMLINIRVSELITENTNSMPLALFIGIFFNMTFFSYNNNNFFFSIVEKTSRFSYNYGIEMSIKNINSLINSSDICLVTSKTWDGVLTESSHITSIGNILYTGYPMWLIITSIILLLAMVGAIVITIKQTN